jgi:chromosome partitioning protein
MAGPRIFCIANQKGGSARPPPPSTWPPAWRSIGQRVLVVDLDPQGNATMGSGVDKRALPASVYDVLLGSASVAEARRRSPKGGYDVLGANRELAGAEVELVELDRRERRLRQALQPVAADYDFVLDRLPAVAQPADAQRPVRGARRHRADAVRILRARGPVGPRQHHQAGARQPEPRAQIIGLLRVMFDPRITLQQQVSEQLKAHFGDKVFDTVIPRNVRLAEAPSYGQPGVVFDPASKGALAYVEFAHEMARRSADRPAPTDGVQPAGAAA